MALLKKIEDEELDLMEAFIDPTAFCECLFDDFDNLSSLQEDEFGHIRNGQISMLSYEYLIDDKDPEKTAKENFKMLEGAGTLYNMGSRKYGKTLIGLVMDMLMSLVHLDGWETIYTSYDANHVRSVMDRLVPAVEKHPFLKLWETQVRKSPSYVLSGRNGFKIISVNQNVTSKNPGDNFFGFHVKKLFMDESSKETQQVYGKRVDSVSELGCIERLSGMTDFTKYSPAGRIFYDLEKSPWICNFPQYISPLWDEKEKEKAAQKYSGFKSIGYKVFVLGEVVESGISVFDMQRVRKNYQENKKIKGFEIDKTNFANFKEILSTIAKMKQADASFICADIGETAPTEIIILFRADDKYYYRYNITLHNLTHKEQSRLFLWLHGKLDGFIGLDCGDGTGRSIYREIEEKVNKSKLFYYDGSKKIVIGFEKNDKDEVIMSGGKPKELEEFMSEYSVKHLKDLLYEEVMVIPIDHKFDAQINSVISTQSGSRTIYDCVSPENHLFDAFKVFSLTEFDKKNKNDTSSGKQFSKVGA